MLAAILVVQMDLVRAALAAGDLAAATHAAHAVRELTRAMA
ncbi:hypothetical protein [Rhodococcus sp. NPDC127528]